MKCLIMKYDSISEKLNEAWVDGDATEEYGSCQEEGFSAALILTDKTIYLGEWPDLTDDIRPLLGIIEENDQGFVDYELFSTEKAAQDKWEDLTNMWERLYHPEAAYA